MALPAAFLSEDQFTCSICLDLFNNPVSTPCGHSFCKSCISSYWGGLGGSTKSYQCPLCKESFRKIPELHVNHTLKDITERFKEVTKDGVPPSQKTGEMPEGIFAEMMTRFQKLHPSDSLHQSQERVRAKLASHSQSMDHDHPPPPYTSTRRHSVSVLDDSASHLPPCPLHLRGLEFFCRNDNTCVCSECVEMAEHRGHAIVPAKKEWLIKKSQLGIEELELKDLICVRERKVEEIQNSLQQIKAAAARETDGTVCAFSKLIASVERCQAEILEMIEMSHRASEHRAQSLLKELEEEIAELKRRSNVLSHLAVSEDYVLFLKTFAALSTPLQTKDWSSVPVSSELNSGVIVKAVDSVVERFQEEIKKLPEISKSSRRMDTFLSDKRTTVEHSVPRPNTKTRRVQEYAANITLDPRTAHPRLFISADLRQVHCGDRHQLVPDNPERFDRVVCVLSRQGFSSGRHYWEVEVGGKTDWDLGVASWSVNRKGKITVSPAHGYWFLSLRDRTEYAFRTEPSTSISVNPRPTRIGIYVDCDKGVVSFYNVEAKMLIYTFTDKFPDTIHPFFSPCTNKSGRNEAPLIICPVSTVE
ncbi:E3 ubiquitin-protein ligase TRIM39-like [Solea senegalensis]|uniref:E3 ubiquitin-protein ligase TRIM39-like n=1 Tax=Solea senegalensis TaxID=28829 RepID=A0AAV6Q8L5_SOLSE|nr:zinc-binding protein A33 [Solea senegalensis]KAG7485386.1 E3 ubiquitin-protein ligase TRIM39-like [Solea senegalensis]